jgi:hypothetical protein
MAKSKDSKPAGGKGGAKADKGDKSKKGGKGNNSKAEDSNDTKAAGKLKGMTINVRHILVCFRTLSLESWYLGFVTLLMLHSFFPLSKSVRNSPRARRPLAG